MREKLRSAAPGLIGLILFAAALLVLRRELHAVSYAEITVKLVSLPASRLVLALLFTALNYAVLAGYDLLAFAYVGKAMDRWRVALAAFVAYAVANNVGFAMLSGASVRYRFYTRWGVSAGELSRIVLLNSITFWLGLLLLGGSSLAVTPLPALHELPGHESSRPLGLLLIGIALAYLVLALLRRAPISVGKFEIPLPAPWMVVAQFGISALDWTLAAAVLHVLLPIGVVPFGAVLGAFLSAQLLGLASHVPGGIGVFETAMVVLLKPLIPAGTLLPCLVVYRLIYYLLPLVAAVGVLGADELRQRREQAQRLGVLFGVLVRQLTPRLLAGFAFLAGAVLLFSGATPAESERVSWLADFLPLPVLEVSHFVGSLTGLGLLLLAQGLSRRLDGAYYAAVCALGIGCGTSLLKGGDYEEATVVALVLLALLASRRHFDRKSAFFSSPLSVSWLLGTLSVVGASIWLGLFAFKHVDYSRDLWWQFEFNQDASRFLRASVGVMVGLLVFGWVRHMRPVAPELPPVSDADLTDAERAIALQSSTVPCLVYLRDKALLFDDARRAFIMYGVQGRSWVALGDPVGPEAAAPGLVRLFLERCDDFDGVPVFYEVHREALHLYADFGLTFIKLGEEARVPLAGFILDAPEAKKLRQAVRRLEKEGTSFRVLPREQVAPLLGELTAVSDDWLRHKGVAEKGFSLGFFDADYVQRFPVALVERGGRIEAFANLWPGSDKQELSLDLMRYRESAPKLVMEGLFAHLMRWGKDQGYQHFCLGMAPLSGFERSALAPLWMRLGGFLYRHGERLYNFQGLRAFKEKFHPVWEARYLAYPGGLSLPRILADVSALIAGGYRRIFVR